GGGPSGLSAAYFLLREGHDVTVYDENPEFGGMLRYGIPAYRLPNDIISQEVQLIADMGAVLISDTGIGSDITLAYLRENYDAIYIAVGMWKSIALGIPGEGLQGVYGGIDFLYEFACGRPPEIGEKVAVIGGGNTAMDAARTAVRMGAEVTVLYRRTRADMPAEEIEIVEAEEEGIKFLFCVSPAELTGEEGHLHSIKLQNMCAIAPANPGERSKIEPIEGAFTELELDGLIVATGQGTDLAGLEDIRTDQWGLIDVVQGTYQTSLPGVFAGGDVIDNGSKIAIQAIADAKHAAYVISNYLHGQRVAYITDYHVRRDDISKEELLETYTTAESAKMGHLSPESRCDSFQEFMLGYTKEQAKYEGERCLECGCMDYFECDLFDQFNRYDVKPERFAGQMNDFDHDNEHPHIMIDPNKCVLCGMCERVCDEVMGVFALGLADRGFESRMMPAAGRRLQDTDCISCGQCVALCPVGALQERRPVPKQVPLYSARILTTCTGCSLGCAQILESTGAMLLRALPVEGDQVSGGLLCEKGRFELERYLLPKEERLMQPLIRYDCDLLEVSVDDAILFLAQGIRAIQDAATADEADLSPGPGVIASQEAATDDEGILPPAQRIRPLQDLASGGKLAISISDNYTSEEITRISSLVESKLTGTKLYSLDYKRSALEEITGSDSSPNKFDEVFDTDLVIIVGGDLLTSHPMLATKIRRAMKGGVRLGTINSRETLMDRWGEDNITVGNIIDEKNCSKTNSSFHDQSNMKTGNSIGAGSLFDLLQHFVHSDLPLAQRYREVGKALLVYDKGALTYEEELMLIELAVVSGHYGAPGNGIIQLKAHANSQGLYDLGVRGTREDLLHEIDSGQLSGLMIFGDSELPEEYAAKLPFLAVQATKDAPHLRHADVILPGSCSAEREGHITSSEGRVLPVHRVFEPTFDTAEQLDKLLSAITA
ncbi:MAG TPA: FAD-dependent oxidoreductase, partial [Clostridiaceae bacterium]|nr:FAD-dependent oxidoreductase [Clostridiaceae bacterium]